MISERFITCRRCKSRYLWRVDLEGDPSVCVKCKKEEEVERLREEKKRIRDSSKGFKIIPTRQHFKQTKKEEKWQKTDWDKKYTPSWFGRLRLNKESYNKS